MPHATSNNHRTATRTQRPASTAVRPDAPRPYVATFPLLRRCVALSAFLLGRLKLRRSSPISLRRYVAPSLRRYSLPDTLIMWHYEKTVLTKRTHS